jgi:hypothetical protein
MEEMKATLNYLNIKLRNHLNLTLNKFIHEF